MSINQRIKNLRKSLKLNQSDFGDRIGLKNSAISKLEQEGNTVVDQNKRIICDKFHISMHWLETGEGDMYAPDSPRDIFDSLREELQLSEVEETILRGYFELDEKAREAVTSFIIKLGLSASKANNPAIPSADNVSDIEIIPSNHNQIHPRKSTAATNDKLERQSISNAEREEAHRLLDLELAAEEKDVSVCGIGNFNIPKNA